MGPVCSCGPFGGHGRRGFTLIEASLAIIIVGVGVCAAMELFAACTQQNQIASRTTVAAMLARNVEETIVGLPFVDPIQGIGSFGPEPGEELRTFDDVDDFHGFGSASLGGPINSQRQPIPELFQYEQQVSVVPVLANNPAIEAGGTEALRIDVAVLWRRIPADAPERLFTASWYKMRQ